MVRIILFFLLTLSVVSCSQYRIEGKSSMDHLNGKMIYLCDFTEDLNPIDSAEIIHGSFKMKGKVDSAMMVIMLMDRRPIGTMVLESGNISVDITNTEMKVSGTDLNERLYSFTRKKLDYENSLNTIDSRFAKRIMDGEDYDLLKKDFEEESKNIMDSYDMLIDSFIRNNYDNVLSVGVFLLISYSTPVEALPESFYSLYENAPESFKDNVNIRKYISRMFPEKICGRGAGRTAGKRMAAGRKIRFHFLYRQRFRGEACHGKGCEIPDAGNAGTGREKPLCGGSVGGYFPGGQADRLRQMAQLRPDLRGPGLCADPGGGKRRIPVRPPVLDGENVRKISVRQSRMGKDHQPETF